jgi:hypothetical protein
MEPKMSNVLVEWVKLVSAIGELKAFACGLQIQNDRLELDLKCVKEQRESDRKFADSLIRMWATRCMNLEAKVANDKRKRQLQAERRNWEKRKRALKRQHSQDASEGEWVNSLNIVHLYCAWKRHNATNPTGMAKALRERLDGWKEAHRVKTTTDRS